MARQKKTPEEIRREAAEIARQYAQARFSCGDEESADEMRDIANDILKIRLTRDVR